MHWIIDGPAERFALGIVAALTLLLVFYRNRHRILPYPPRICLALFAVLSVVIGAITLDLFEHAGQGFWPQLLFEAYGTLLDILVIGGLVFWLHERGVRQRTVESYRCIIDDFRGWFSPQAARRIAGNIRRLNRSGIHDIDLTRCCLRQMNLAAMDLTGSKLVGADLQQAWLEKIILKKADLQNANLKGAFLRKADVSQALLWSADLRGAVLEGANLSKAQMTGAIVAGVDFRNADLTRVKGLTIDQLATAGSLAGTRLDDKLSAAVEAQYPHLRRRHP
jgi:hypothetical protein